MHKCKISLTIQGAFIFAALLFALSAFGGTVVVTNAYFTRDPAGLRGINVVFSDAPISINGVGIVRDRIRYTNDGSGFFAISNYVPGFYRFEFQGPYTTTTNYFCFPDTNGVIAAHDPQWSMGPSNILSAGQTVYTKQAADARFLRNGGTNYGYLTLDQSPGAASFVRLDGTNGTLNVTEDTDTWGDINCGSIFQHGGSLNANDANVGNNLNVSGRASLYYVLLSGFSKANRPTSVSAGAVIFQTDATPGLRVYNGTHWVKFSESNDD